MNILIGKIGRPIFFHEKRWDIYAGDEEGPLLYRMLAGRHPEHTFYLIGRSDFDDCGEPLPGNIINLLDGCPAAAWSNQQQHRDATAHFWLMDNIKSKNFRFDVGIFYLGPSSCVSVPGVGMKNLTGEEAKSLQMLQNYGAPILHTLNETCTPYFLLCGDPRYLPWRARDAVMNETVILSQVNCDALVKRVKSYKDQTIREHRLRYRYAGIETIFMLKEQKVDFRPIKKDIQFTMFLNGKGSFSADRESFLESWVLNGHEGARVYGIWNDDFLERWPGRIENKGLRDLRDEAFRTRYTMIPPFTRSKSNFVTQKFWKMIYYGIIPFFHPHYDTDRIFDVPAILRPNSADEMWATIERLDFDEAVRSALVSQLYNLLDDGYFNGDKLHDQINLTMQMSIGEDLNGHQHEPWTMPDMPLMRDEEGRAKSDVEAPKKKFKESKKYKPAATPLLEEFYRALMNKSIAKVDANRWLRDHDVDPLRLSGDELRAMYQEIIKTDKEGTFS